MHIEVIGINHVKTGVALRSKLAIGSAYLQEALVSLHSFITQGMIISTCNRTEIYFISQDGIGRDRVYDYLKTRSGLTSAVLQTHVYTYTGTEAVNHLFRVASGLDSVIVGEYEILGQVKRSLQAALKSGLTDSPLLELFRRAIICGRKVRNQTGISRHALSISSVAVDLALRSVQDAHTGRILIVGAGEAGHLAAKACRDRGIQHLTVASRSSRKGTAFAREIQGSWVHIQNLEQELAGQDAVICCSGAPHTVLKLEMVKRAMVSRSERPLTVIDIGVPCNADPEIKKLKEVSLHNIDELMAVCHTNLEHRQSEVCKAKQMVEKDVDRFLRYWHELKVKPLVTSLVNKAESIRLAKLSLALKKSPGLSAEEQANIEALSKSIIQKLLHDPIQCLKANHKNEEYLRIVKEMFSLESL